MRAGFFQGLATVLALNSAFACSSSGPAADAAVADETTGTMGGGGGGRGKSGETVPNDAGAIVGAEDTPGVAAPDGGVTVPTDARADGGGGANACTTFEPGDLRWPMPNQVGMGLPNPQQYDTSMPGVVIDKVTGLSWKQATGPGSYTQPQAKAYCAGLGDGWRLPTLIELVSLIDLGQEDPGLDPVAFPGAPLGFYCTSTASEGGGNAWYVAFGGLTHSDDPSRMGSARCVR